MKRLLLLFTIYSLFPTSGFAQADLAYFADSQNAKDFVDSNNSFAFKLLENLNHTENIVFSPYCISSALAMTYAGARGETEEQMSNTLNFSLAQDTFHLNFKRLNKLIASDNSKNIQLDIANSLWAQKDYNFLDSYLNLVKITYNDELKSVDFINPVEREKARIEINQWVEQKTKDKIKDLIAEGILSDATRLVLVNAIYFHGKWAKPFADSLTEESTFYTGDGKPVQAKFMNKWAKYNYYEDGDVQVIELPYAGSKASMLIFLPKKKDGLINFETVFTYSYYKNIISSLQDKRVNLSLPKFKMLSYFGLGDVLASMGMPIAFTDAADFSGMNGKKDLQISKVIHKAYINVSEEGTEAAAATAITIGVTSIEKEIDFTADHSFIYIIRENATGSILFMGQVLNPSVAN